MPGLVRVPCVNVNDEKVTVGEWLVENGELVSEGQDIVVYETSKTVINGQAPENGHIRLLAEPGDEFAVGEVIARIDAGGTGDATQKAVEPSCEGPRCTKKAEALIKKHNIDVSCLAPGRIIREKDLEALIGVPRRAEATHSNEIIIYGGGGFAPIIIDLLQQTCVYRLKGLVDMNYPAVRRVATVDVVGGDEYLDILLERNINKAVNAVDHPHRAGAYEKLREKGFELPNLTHRAAIIEPSVTMGEGNLVFAGAMLGSWVTLGNDCVINAGAIVNHECRIGDNSHIASGAILAGRVAVGENTLIGQGCTVYQDVTIGNNVVVCNGCDIFHDIPDNAVVKSKEN